MKKRFVFLWLGLVSSASADQILVDFQLVPSQSLLQAGGYAQLGAQQFPSSPQSPGADLTQWAGTIRASVNRSGIDPLAIELNPSTIAALPSGLWQPLGTPAAYGVVLLGLDGALRDYTLDLSQSATNLSAGGTFTDAMSVVGNGTLDVSSGSSYTISSLGAFTPGQASLTAAPLPNGDNLWTLQLPIHLSWSLSSGALTVVGTLDGTITGTADVPPPPVFNFPEPTSGALACVGLGIVIAWRRWRR